MGTNTTKLKTAQEAAEVCYLIGVCYMTQMLSLQVIQLTVKSALNQLTQFTLFTFLMHVSEYYYACITSKKDNREVAFYHSKDVIVKNLFLI